LNHNAFNINLNMKTLKIFSTLVLFSLLLSVTLQHAGHDHHHDEKESAANVRTKKVKDSSQHQKVDNEKLDPTSKIS